MVVQWKIGFSSGGASSASTTADLNISGLTISRNNHADDVATWTCEGDGIGSPSRFPYGSDISVWKVEDGTPERVFRGVVTSVPREGEGAGERVSYEARGGWYFLQKCFYTQSWASGSSGTMQSQTRVILGYDSTGTISPNAQISSIVACAIAAGAPISASTPAVSAVKLPADEQVDLTCADAINRILS